MLERARFEEAVRALHALERRGLATLAAERRPAVAEWRHASFRLEPHWPDPWHNERSGSDPYWLEDAGPSATRVGFDAAGRPVLAERGPEGAEAAVEDVWLHEDGRTDRLSRRDGAARLLYEGPRVAWIVTLEGGGPGVERWTYEDAAAVRGDIGQARDDYVVAATYVAELDADGRLAGLVRGAETPPRGEGDDHAAVAVALAQAAALVPDHVVYDARLDRYEPRLRPSEELLAVLPRALVEATAAAVAASGVERPFAVDVRLREDEQWPPFVRVGGARFRERMRRGSPDPGAALHSLYKASPPEGATLQLPDHLSDDALRACRELNAALDVERPHDHPDRVRASELSEAIGRAVAEGLNDRPWPGAEQPFLALVRIGRQYEPVDPYELARAVVGDARVAAFRASVESRLGEPPRLDPDARRDRDALAAALTVRGLGAHAERLAHEVAEPGLRLEPAGGGARSRLGGPPLLPPGTSWPHDATGTPLTFLAGLDLAELRPPDPLPAEGWLLFFAHVDASDDHLLDFTERNVEGELARVLHVPPGVEPVPAEPPPGVGVTLQSRPVRAVPQLTLPDDYDAAERLGLDAAEEDAYERTTYELMGDMEGGHWVLGASTGAQGHPVDEDSVLLLQIAWDEPLGFEFLDGGAIQFRIPRAALAAGDWTAVTAMADSS